MGILMKNGVPYASGSEIPEGGTKGQVLAKASDISGDFEWVNGGGGTGETPTLEQVLTKGNSTTNTIDFSSSGNDDTSVSGSGMYATGTGTEGMRQVVYNQHGISAVDNLVGTITDIFKVDYDNEQVAMSDGVKNAFKTALGVQGATFVIDTANPCSYNELQNAITTPNVILIKHEGNVYPFVEKWESDENTKRYVNIASLQRQGIDKGAVYFFFEATIGDFYSPMAYSSSFVQPTGKPYADSVAGNLANLTTTEKTNLVGAVNEINGNLGTHLAVGKETWYGTYTDENNVVYQVYSKVVYIPALPSAAGITTYSHGVSNIKQILSIYGFTTDGFVLNAPRQTASDNIAIYQASKNPTNQTFSIEVGKDRSSKSAYVVMVYAKNN